MAEIASFIKFPRRPSAKRDEELLKLYWNRANVKRELAALRRERHDLLDKLKEQEGVVIRVQEQLDGLERLLTNPLAAANAMVYFQLRHLWRVAAKRVEQFTKELSVQRERRERAKLQETALEKRQRRIGILDDKLQSLLIKVRNTAHEAEILQQQLDRMNGIQKVFKGPAIKRRISGLSKGREALELRIDDVKETKNDINAEPLPEPDGLSLDSRRLVNVAVLALAQELVLHFTENDLAGLAKTAMEKPVGDMKFGDRRDCDRVVERIRARVGEMEDQRIADAVKLRTDYLLTQINYSDDDAAVPLPETFETIPWQVPGLAGGTAQKRETHAPLRANVLADGYWDVLDVLL